MSTTYARLKRLDARLERPILWTFLGAAILVAVINLTLGLVHLITGLTSDRIPLSLLIDAPLPAEADAGTAQLVEGTFSSASVLISGLSSLPIFLWALSNVVAMVTTALICAAVAHLCWKLLRRRAFDQSVSWMATSVGAVLVLGSTLGGALGGFGLMVASTELDTVSPGGFWPLGFQVDPTPVLVGFVILLVAMVFEVGNRLQRDTEGLV
ncbi:hypothetical protein D6T64_19380 [Cryobacterium melibiosiphilum]|uniref:DUF2975 domain-containing protein n=1 Tax=Cryobacterium melibiosiphilum TaxID=995039 RepID=A0A3A5MKW9_9MICO|nr:hypothetical protein [Cryobacterium melibiosiphilum]RJT85107.1 hypothetical protein D6T64_19380 [Cryobacterium melibiosiphilum]